MTVPTVFGWVVVLTALFYSVNHRVLKLPPTIGLAILSLATVLVLGVLDLFGFNVLPTVSRALEAAQVGDVMLKVVLGVLLFAGALHIDLSALWERRYAIGILSTAGVLVSAFIIALGMWALLAVLGLYTPLTLCLLFGALISPTDPIAVLALLKQTNVPKDVEMKIAGEALLNDGMAVVLFITVLGLWQGTSSFSVVDLVVVFVREIIGGIVFGLVIGWAAYGLIKRSHHYHEEILLSLALVVGGYIFAQSLHVSGPLAMVAAGLYIGSHRSSDMPEDTKEHLDVFWEVMDFIFNAAVFVLIGFMLALVAPRFMYFIAGALAIGLVLFARFASVMACGYFTGLMHDKSFHEHTVAILTWGGLRGGICLALALGLPKDQHYDKLLMITVIVVVFSLIVQGLSMKALLRRYGF